MPSAPISFFYWYCGRFSETFALAGVVSVTVFYSSYYSILIYFFPASHFNFNHITGIVSDSGPLYLMGRTRYICDVESWAENLRNTFQGR